MKFVIVGYGRVGERTCRVLAGEDHEVAVIDTDPGRVALAREAGFETIEGDGADEERLVEAGIETADAVGGLTADLNANFAACMIGAHHGCRTVMRIDEDYRKEIYQKYAEDVDEVIYPERLGAAGAKTALLGGDFNVVADLAERLQLSVLTVGEDAPVAGELVGSVDLPDGVRLYAYGAAGDPLDVPMPGDRLSAEDRVALLIESDGVDVVRTRFGAEAP